MGAKFQVVANRDINNPNSSVSNLSIGEIFFNGMINEWS